jgi:Phage integrase family
MMYE